MNPKHLSLRIKQCRLLADMSPCPRRKVGAVILDPTSNVLVSEGYNGTPRGATGVLCGDSVCHRDTLCIKHGERNDVGCHHAEANAILNATRIGNSTLGKWMICSCDPCLMCAKLIHHAGIERIYVPMDICTHTEGIQYLQAHSVLVLSTNDQESAKTGSNEY